MNQSNNLEQVYKKTLSEKLKVESLQNAMFDAAVDGIITITKQGLILSFNHAAETLFGYKSEEVINKNVKVLMPSPHQESHDSYLANYNNSKKAQIIGTGRDVIGRRKSGTNFPMRLSVGESEVNNEVVFIGICHDLTDYHNTQNKLAKAEERYKNIVECQGQIVCRINNELKVTFANQSFQDIFKKEKKDVIGSYFVDFVTTDKKTTERVLDKVIDSSLANQLSYKTLMARKNDTVNIEWWFSKVTNESGITEIQGFGIDISEKEEAIRQAEFLKRYDPLTGFLNTDEFFIAFNNTLNKNKMAIIYLDFNHFNLINNKYGFDSGDTILIEASKRLKRCLKQPALLCRPNRASFIIALEIKDANESTIFAESILNCLTGLYLINNEEIRLNAKIGVSIYPKDSSLINNSIRKAESVLAKAKFSKNNIAYYDKKFNASLQRQLDVEQRLLVALESNLLQVFLQPKVNLITRTVVGYEALLRWEDPVLGSISPVEFIKVAEEMALAIHIDRYVIKTVLMSIRRCLDKGLSILPIAVNITSSHFAEASLVEYIISESEALDVDLNYLDLEVTEGVLLEVNEQVESNLDILRAKSVKISIDDFGTGYSSLSYLRKLSVDAIKIDKSFVDDLFDDVGHQLVLAIVTIAKAVNLDVIVEGIETEEQLELLVNLGCITGQGYLFAKPQFICDVLSMQISDFKKDSLKLKNVNL